LCEREAFSRILTLILLKWRIWPASNNASKWRMGFNSAFKVLKEEHTELAFENRVLGKEFGG